jgi:elongation factor Ts
VTIDYACKELTGKIGEKIALRRYELLQKNDNEIFAYYEHTNGKIAVLLIIDKEIDPVVAKDIAMHAAAMAPKFLNETKVDPE